MFTGTGLPRMLMFFVALPLVPYSLVGTGITLVPVLSSNQGPCLGCCAVVLMLEVNVKIW
jgi:hypothetical protein